jgi:flagellar biosynthesis GTPase FlhF
MKLRKFVAARTTDALAQIKAELGPDAVIVSVRELPRAAGGPRVEVTAALDPDDRPPASRPVLAGSAAPDLDQLRSELLAMREFFHGDRPARRSIAAPSEGRIVALVGPTGAGKTTTIAKIAARAALLRSESVAIVTLDTYRVGGEQQIRIFADLIGAPLYTVRDPKRLSDQIERLGTHDRIFVDTAGRSPSAENEIAAMMNALGAAGEIEIHLALPADSRPSAIDRWADRIGRGGIDRLLFTKVDEAECLEEVVLAPERLDCPVSYVTTGQRVPEDIVQATDGRLRAIAIEGARAEREAA